MVSCFRIVTKSLQIIWITTYLKSFPQKDIKLSLKRKPNPSFEKKSISNLRIPATSPPTIDGHIQL